MPLHYETYWFVNDKYVAVKEVALWSGNYVENSRLTEDDLKRAGFHKFGFDVRCSVRVRDKAGGFPGPSRLSEPQFAGIKIENPTLSVKQGETKQLSVISTVPFKCGTKFGDCRVNLEVRAPPTDDNTGCNPKPLVQTDCNLPLQNTNTRYHFQVTGETTLDNGAFYSLTKLNLTTISNEMSFFHEYTVGIATVEVSKDGSGSVADGSVCHAVCDPHMLTFDGRYYEHQYTGHYVLYKNEEHNIEVQMTTAPCGDRATPTCPCAIAIRSGRTVFRFDRCAGYRVPWEIGFATCGGRPEEMAVHKKHSQYQVYLPTGTTIKVDVRYVNLNVFIYPSEADIGLSSGLCGTLTGHCCDDISGSWSLDKHNSLFDDDVVKDLESFTVLASYCTCETKPNESSTSPHDKVLCPATKAKQCIYPANYIPVNDKNSCAIRTRRRRSIGPNLESRNRRSTEWMNGWTAELKNSLTNQRLSTCVKTLMKKA
ncbi:von Willebrand factor D and EGF domain-containing protein-like [Haliotis rubra]|uniref:von Willebrand factor D and EGF domain-containing protein-like n=1 Tax=Haliotis rubra TaxID=36100 RepID=UPI001EE53A23|nr:von Willebrand factor D and EGF domain-containing protein-like [Haliotis rubra]